MRRAAFLDRDGTINRDVGYLNHPDQFELLPGAAQAIISLRQAGFLAVVVTNQAGVAKGFIPRERLPELRDAFCRLLEGCGAAIDGYYSCPHHPDGFVEEFSRVCQCRKPQPGLLQQAAADLEIDLTRSFVVGDKLTDIQLAANVGAQGVLVLTGHGTAELFRHPHAARLPHHTAGDISQAVRWIIQHDTA